MTTLPSESEPKIIRARCVGEDGEPGAKDQEMILRQGANYDPNKVTSQRLTEQARHKYGANLTPSEPVASLLDRVDEESVIPEEDDPSGKRESFDGEDLSDLEANPSFVEYLK